MSSWAIVTGGSSGIGAAIFRRIVQREPGVHCLAVGRRLSKLEEVRAQAIADAGLADAAARARVRVVAADVSTEEGVAAIVAALPADASVRYLIHNAGVLGPIGPVTAVDRAAWRQAVATNLDAPLFLTQALLPRLTRCAAKNDGTKARVLHVGSGAAHGAYVGWGPYCVTKAGLHMLFRCLAAELTRHDILVGSVRPGVVATDMQVGIRAFDGPADDFPMLHKFHELHEAGKLERPDAVATYLHWLLSEVNDEEFSKEEWDFRSSKDDDRWKAYELR